MGIYVLTLTSGKTDPEFGDLDVTSNITIEGVSQEVTVIDAISLNDRILHVAPESSLTLRYLTLTNGTAHYGINGASGAGGGNGESGGAILSEGSPLTLRNVTLSANQAGSGGNGGNGVTAQPGANGGTGGNGGAIAVTGEVRWRWSLPISMVTRLALAATAGMGEMALLVNRVPQAGMVLREAPVERSISRVAACLSHWCDFL